MEDAHEQASRNAQKARVVAVLALAANLNCPLVYLDVGALWGVDNPLVGLLKSNGRLRIVGIEPDEAECERLRNACPGDLYLSCGLGDLDGTRPFYLTAFNACASFLEPDLDALRGHPHAEMYRVIRTTELPMRRFDTLIAQGALPIPDFVKIDAQGFELNILKGCGEKLREIVGVRLETQLRPLYKGQGTFFDIYAFVRGAGLILRDLRLTYPIGYEVVEMEAFFSVDPQVAGNKLQALKLWELIHDIPPGRTVQIRDGRIEWISLPM